MKIRHPLAGALLLPFSAIGILLASHASLVAASITVPNYSFESGTSNWTESVGSGGFGTYSPTVAYDGYAAPNGSIVAYVYSSGNSAALEIVSAASLATIAANTTYTLTVAVGNDKYDSSNSGSLSANIALLAGGTAIPRAIVTGIRPASGTIGDYSVTFTTTASDPLVGKALTIQLGQDAGYSGTPAPNFDNVRLNATSAAGNQLDRIDFGNTASESAHSFDSGFSAVPAAGSGALGQTYRLPYGSNYNSPSAGNGELQFTMTVDSAKQNYLSVRMWGNDRYTMYLYLNGTESYGAMDNCGGPAPYPDRFYYDTVPIPLSMTQGKTSVQLILYECNTSTSYPARPIYSAYTHTEPRFIPSGADATGAALPFTGQLTPTTLTTSQVVSLLQTNRQDIYGSNGYYSQILARQVPSGTSGAPKEVIGLDLYTPVTSFTGSNPTPDQWRDQCGGGSHGPGYATLPDEMLSVLTATYLLPPFTDANGNTVTGLDHYHDSSIIQRIVACLDGTSYLQSSDGHYQAQPYAVWNGVTSTPRASGHTYAGSTSRGPGWTITLEGADTDCLGRTIIALLNDSTAAPIFKSYLTQSYDADLTGGSMMRAYAYERMLNNQISFLYGVTGAGTISQGLFGFQGWYCNLVALNKLQALYPYPSSTSTFPNDSYSYPINYPSVTSSAGVSDLEQITGIVAGTTFPGLAGPSGYTNYAISTGGFGEAGGTLSCGYDGRYGTILPWIVNSLVPIAAADPAVSSTILSDLKAQAQATANYLRFVSPEDNFAGNVDHFTLSQEDFITYRDPYNPNADAGSFDTGIGYAASDPNIGVNSALERRGAYLEALYNYLPGTGKGGGSQLIYLNTLASYEATLRGLINVSPSSLTALPGEPGQPNSAFVDPETGTTAVYCYGERLYANINWRNTTSSGNASDLARIHDTTSTVDRAALVFTPTDSTTVQSDGNLSGTKLQQQYFLRYGNWLIAGNPTGSGIGVTLPAGSGVAVDVATGNKYNMGSSVSLASGGVLALNLAVPATTEVIPGGTYVLTNQASGLVLNCPNGSNTNGLQITQSTPPGGTSPQWVFTYTGNGLYTIKNVASGQYLTDLNGSTSSGVSLVQEPVDNKSDQAWLVVPSGGAFVFVNQASGNLAINDPGASTTSGQGMILYSQDGGANSVWALQLVPGTAPQPVANGTYTLTLELDGLALDDPNGSTTPGTVVQQNTSTGATSQQWVFTYQSSGYYTIKNVASGLYLGCNSSGGGSPAVYAATGGSDQLWQLIYANDGYELVNVLDPYAIDDTYGSTQTNWNMEFYTYAGSTNQTWVFTAH